MVDVKTEAKPQTQRPENPRKAIREARQRRLRVIDGPPRTIKVFAANEDMRAVLRHPNKIRFRSGLNEGVEWPNDSFTKRRIADGSVRIDGPASEGDPAPVNESLNPRQQSATRFIKDAVQDGKPKPPSGEKPEHPIVLPLQLTALSPNTAVAGSTADIVMSCIGTGFTKETVIKFGDYDEPTTFVSATEVTTGVKPSLFINPDTVPVLVHSGEVSSAPLTFSFTEPSQPAHQPAKAAPKSTAR